MLLLGKNAYQHESASLMAEERAGKSVEHTSSDNCDSNRHGDVFSISIDPEAAKTVEPRFDDDMNRSTIR